MQVYKRSELQPDIRENLIEGLFEFVHELMGHFDLPEFRFIYFDNPAIHETIFAVYSDDTRYIGVDFLRIYKITKEKKSYYVFSPAAYRDPDYRGNQNYMHFFMRTIIKCGLKRIFMRNYIIIPLANLRLYSRFRRYFFSYFPKRSVKITSARVKKHVEIIEAIGYNHIPTTPLGEFRKLNLKDKPRFIIHDDDYIFLKLMTLNDPDNKLIVTIPANFRNLILSYALFIYQRIFLPNKYRRNQK